ncbi:MAG: hypothetical protein V1745_02150 [Patescibacteria group bacterium]
MSHFEEGNLAHDLRGRKREEHHELRLVPTEKTRIVPPVKADVMRRRQEEDAHIKENVERLREKVGPSRDRFVSKSGHGRETAALLVEEFKNALETKKLSEEEMDAYGEWLANKRDDLEDLNREMRLIPADTFKTSDIMKENFQAIEKIQDAIAASRQESPKEALKELMIHAGVRKYENEKIDSGHKAGVMADDIEARIREEYGMHPEELRSNGAGWKGIKFNLNGILSRLTGQKSLYDKWRDAKIAEEAGAHIGSMRKIQPKRVRPTPEAKRNMEETLQEHADVRMKTLEGELQKNREFSSRVLTRERAAAIWDEVKGQMDLMKSEHPSGWSFSPEEYVFTAARYVDALENGQKDGAKEYKEALTDMNKELDFPEGIDPLLGDSKSRLMKARSIGTSRARGEMEQVVSTMIGVPPRTEEMSRPRRPVRKESVVQETKTEIIPDEEDVRARVNRALEGNVAAARILAAESKTIKPGSLADVYVDAVARLNEALTGSDEKRIEKEQKHVDRLDEVIFRMKKPKPLEERFIPGKNPKHQPKPIAERFLPTRKKQPKPIAERFIPRRSSKPPMQEAA